MWCANFKSKTLGDFNSDTVLYFDFREIYDLKVPLVQVQAFCIKYQKENIEYSTAVNNCRKFMIELCELIHIQFPNTMNCEQYCYKAGNSSNKASKYK